MKPRDYQQWAVDAIYTYLETEKGNPIVAMPTGTGKSVVNAEFIRSLFQAYPNQRILCLTHVKELIEQNFEKLKKMWPNSPAGINSASLKRRDYLEPIIFAGIASVNKYAHIFGHTDLVIIDECHLVSPTQKTMYRKFIAELTKVNPYLRVIGLTATPWRLGRGKLHEDPNGLFNGIAIDMTTKEAFNWFIEQGYLSPVIPQKTEVYLDVEGVGSNSQDFLAGELQTAVNKDWITEKALREAIEIGSDRSTWLIFTTGIEHAIDACDMLNNLGIPCGTVHSDKKRMTQSRDDVIEDLKSGKLRAVTNNNVLTTGVDIPSIDYIIVLRPTKSVVLWVQMIGRGTRVVYAEGDYDLDTKVGRLNAIMDGSKHNCLVADFAANTKRLGPINDPVLPTLHKGKKTGQAPIKECPKCKNYIHASLRFCNGFNVKLNEDCDHEFVFETKLKQDASTKELLAEDAPVVEIIDVTHVTYARKKKKGRPDSIKITYYSGLARYIDYLCIEHGGQATRYAKALWEQRTSIDFPETVDKGLELVNNLKHPKRLRVWTNKQFPEILAYSYSNEENDFIIK